MTKHDGAWYDRMYNNRALVPEHETHFARWRDTSAQARKAHRCMLDVAYGQGPNESLDIFPAEQAHAPVVVFIHGGYWRSLDKSDFSFVAGPFVAQGCAVAVANYDFTPASDEECGFRAGQNLVLAPKHLQPRVRGWLLASSNGRKSGLVPANYIKILGRRSNDVSPPDIVNSASAMDSVCSSTNDSVAR